MTPTVLAKPSDVKSTIQWLVHLESSTNIWSYETLVIAEEYRLQPTSKSTSRSQFSCNPEHNPSTRSASTISEMYHNGSPKVYRHNMQKCLGVIHNYQARDWWIAGGKMTVRFWQVHNYTVSITCHKLCLLSKLRNVLIALSLSSESQDLACVSCGDHP
jgi:hypothetical protein